MAGTANRNKWMAGAGALALVSFGAGAQVRQPPADVAGTAPAPTATPIKINPRDVINKVDTILNPKPKPTSTPTPTPTPTGRPTATPTATPTKAPDPRPTATATAAPKPSPTATAQPPRPTPVVIAAPTAEPVTEPVESPTTEPTLIAEPESSPIVREEPTPQAESSTGWLGWIAAFVAALAVGGYALKQWLRPKLNLSCEIETGKSTLTASSNPAITAPDLAFTIRIEPGEASAPVGNPVLASGDHA